ncbi:MAG TPA: hypothetical protein VHC18_18535 [Amycolatopsis sp.]|nr:hypothetical protein [Amycolatopsis sp.]
MVATKHMRSGPPMPRADASKPSGTSDTDAIERLLQQAAEFGLRAPELALVLGERAASLAETAGSDPLWVRAEGLVVSARVRLGHRADSVARGVAVLRAAEDLGETRLAARLRTALAVCARSVGAPLTGLAALRPVLGAEGLPGADKAAALCQLVGCLSQFGRKPELDRAFVEADKLCGADQSLDGDGRLLARAFLRVGMSAHRRRHADILGAADAARTGLGLLDQLDDPGCDGGVVRVRLILHLVCSLLDRGDSENALEIAEPLLDAPARAASIAPLGWLRMAVATRILLPMGSVEAAGVMLRDAVYTTERHGLHALASRLWIELSNVEHRLGRASDAMECLHQTRAAEHVYGRSRRQAVGLLSGEFGNGGHTAMDLDDVLGAAPHTAPVPVAETARREDGQARGHGVRPAPVRGDAPASGTSEALASVARADVASAVRVSELLPGAERSAEVSKPDSEIVHASEKGSRQHADRGDKPVPDLPLAPAPADEPAPRFSLVFEPAAPKADARSGGVGPRATGGSAGVTGSSAGATGGSGGVIGGSGGAAVAAAGTQPINGSADSGAGRRAPADASDAPVERHTTGGASDASAEVRGVRAVEAGADRPLDGGAVARAERQADASSAKRTTRHDSEHGSVAARSVLDRLGITAGSGGGRRRADSAEQNQGSSPAFGSNRKTDTARTVAAAGPSREGRRGVRGAGDEPDTATAGADAAHDASATGTGSARSATGAPAGAEADTGSSSAAGTGRGSAARIAAGPAADTGSGSAPETVSGSAARIAGGSAAGSGGGSAAGTATTGAAGIGGGSAAGTATAGPAGAGSGPAADAAGGSAAGTTGGSAPETATAGAKTRLGRALEPEESEATAPGSESGVASAALDRSLGGAEAEPKVAPSTEAARDSADTAGGRVTEPDGREGITRSEAEAANWSDAVASDRAAGAGRHGGTATGAAAAPANGDDGAQTGRTDSADESGAREAAEAAGGEKSSSADVRDESPGVDDAGGGSSAGANENWLPRLRLPPSLEPFEDYTDEALAATSETPFTSTPNIEDGGLEPFRADQGGASFLDEELPADAGLADLLARALAEHRAGTSSAAALVKRLGNGSEAKRPVNGHSRNGEAPGDGRHRTDG